MKDSITILPWPGLAGRAAAQVARWWRRLSGRLQAADTFARQAGWTITRTRFGGRIYRDPRFGHLSITRAPGTPAVGPPAASSRSPTGTGRQRAASDPARKAESERRNR